jgi:hypothetical protein
MTTYAIPIVSQSEAVADVDLLRVTRASVAQGITREVANNGQETNFAFIAGDAAHLSDIRVGNYPPAAAGKAYNKSAKFSTWSKAVDGDGAEIWKPFTATMATSDLAGLGVLAPADYLKVLMMLFSVLVPGATAGAPSQAAVDLLQYGTTDILHVTP